jgi:hypothetical protein
MPSQSGAKANGAAHRMGNTKLKERRKSSWARGEKRKARRTEQAEAHRRNMATVSEGCLTPWQAAKMKNTAARLRRKASESTS